ncbi:hypothetical protein ABZX88_00695 [Kitasatospora aureofaciens]|uniref:hypothetical protein n=1 Tax=Kitasatospora aureofaciens TaxID=1894 RepID=UPI0033AAED44
MTTETMTGSSQLTAASALLAILTAHTDLPAPQVDLRPTYVPSIGAVAWGLHLTVHDDLGVFEQWRSALDLDPAAVDHKHNLAGYLAWLTVTGMAFGVPVALVGFYNLPEPADTWA